MNGVGERRHVETSLDGAKSARERERERESDQSGVQSLQGLAVLNFLPWLLNPKLVHF